MQEYRGMLTFLTMFVLTVSGCRTEHSTTADAGAAKEMGEDSVVLFDGADDTLSHFKGVTTEDIPKDVWAVGDGQIVCTPRSERPEGAKGSIVTKRQYRDFDFRLEYRLDPTYEGNVNSGIKYFAYPGKELGLEYQILDYNGEVRGPHGLGDLYDLMEARRVAARPRGQWNEIRIVSRDQHVEHWLNGEKVLEFERGSQAFRAAVAQSKFKDRDRFGEAEQGHILLQDHGGGIAFRNIRIKVPQD